VTKIYQVAYDKEISSKLFESNNPKKSNILGGAILVDRWENKATFFHEGEVVRFQDYVIDGLINDEILIELFDFRDDHPIEVCLPDLSKEQIAHWRKNGGCPKCVNEDGNKLDYHYDLESHCYRVKCNQCGYKWLEVYKFVLVEKAE